MDRVMEPTKNDEVLYLQALIEDLVNEHYRYKEATKVTFKNENAKIIDQMGVLHDWWHIIDPE